MKSGTIKYHYFDLAGIHKVIEATTHHFSLGLEELENEICLVNTCFDDTGFEEIPQNISTWLDEIGLDFPHFPNLTRMWGDKRSEYALTLRYEIGNEYVDNKNLDYPILMTYDEQLILLKEAAAKIAETIPYALVRLSEKGACYEQHELEVAFLHPCSPQQVMDGVRILEERFDYVWDIGRSKSSEET